MNCSCLARRNEYIRLLEQALGSLGFHEAAERLQQESGVSLEAAVVGKLRSAVTVGAYDTAADLIEQLPISSPDAVQKAKFLIWQQKFLEVQLSISAASTESPSAISEHHQPLGCM